MKKDEIKEVETMAGWLQEICRMHIYFNSGLSEFYKTSAMKVLDLRFKHIITTLAALREELGE